MAMLLSFKWCHLWFISSNLLCNMTASSWDAKEPSNFLPAPLRELNTSRWLSISDCKSCNRNKNKNMRKNQILKSSFLVSYVPIRSCKFLLSIENWCECTLHLPRILWREEAFDENGKALGGSHDGPAALAKFSGPHWWRSKCLTRNRTFQFYRLFLG